MKTDTIAHVPQAEVALMLAELVEQKGTHSETVKALGISKQKVSTTIRGAMKPPRKVLEHFKLEAKTVYVIKGKKRA